VSSSLLIVALFALGYLAIVFEHSLHLSKAASALLTGVACWTVLAVGADAHAIEAALVAHMGEMSQLLFFLLGAMTIVELIDAHDGFDLITARIKTRSRRKLLVTITLLAFFLSAVLDNLTTSIVMMTLIRKLVGADTDRMVFGGMVIVAANAGGVWSPIGDVTTTMLWVGGNITTAGVVGHLLVPALISAAVPLAWVVRRQRGEVIRPGPSATGDAAPRLTTPRQRTIVLAAGLGVLLFVPVFKTITHLPPVMGILLGLGVLWTLTAVIHRKRSDDEGKSALSVSAALQRVDAESVLFFLGILLAISALESAGVLRGLAHTMDRHIGNVDVITLAIGLASAVVDNVPLVAAAQAMYSPATFPTDHSFWVFLAYCAGTGGSILIIGSAAGIAVMGIQRITFAWYVRHMSVPALLGFAAGAIAYLGLNG
jgi:Na+/H+ antiporter NhaD/arsenite permease-like protein